MIRRARRWVRIAREEYALSPSTASGRVRGPPYWPGHAQLLQKRKQHRGVPCLAGGDQADQRQPGPIDELMDLRAQPSPGAPDAVIGRLLMQIPVVRPIPL